jgi:hypothetical protein
MALHADHHKQKIRVQFIKFFIMQLSSSQFVFLPFKNNNSPQNFTSRLFQPPLISLRWKTILFTHTERRLKLRFYLRCWGMHIALTYYFQLYTALDFISKRTFNSTYSCFRILDSSFFAVSVYREL